MIVTEVIPLDKKRSKVFLDGDFAFVLYKGELKKYKIEPVSAVEEHVYQEIMEALRKRARERAIHILKSGDRTEAELMKKLKNSGYPLEAVEAAISLLKSYGYINDEHYARRYLEIYGEKKSRRQLANDLQLKGIPKEYIRLLMEEVPVDEESQIRRFLEKKRLDPEQMEWKEKQKTMGSLYRKGFSQEAIQRAFR